MFLLADGVILVVVLLRRFIYILSRPFIVIVLVNLYAFFHLSLHNLHGDNDNAKTEKKGGGGKRSGEERKKPAAVKKLVLMPLLYCLHCCFLSLVCVCIVYI